ncbi:hypothetical protein INR49_023261 [Caranx melampygus]|nr:hypothetical protein INR49_023261 [Caranx melampygus]
MAPDRDFKELTAQARPSQAVEERCAGVKVQSASRRSGVNAPSLLLPSALKKPLLPSLGPASKPSGISYKLSRPSFINKSRPLRVTTANGLKGDQEVKLGQRGGGGAETPPSTGNSAETTPEAPETEGLSTEPVSQAEVSIVGETLEDMSLSSTSSLDRNDTSQEYMDDFDNLGSGGVGLMLLSSSKNDEDDSGLDQSCARFDDDKLSINGVTKATGLCFLDDGMDWPGMRLSGDRAEHHGTRRQRCSQQEYHDQGGSSLDLSPSDSCGSGGTYMWDEEGLEPLGGAVTSASINTNGNTTHHIGSFDSDLNSIDILNNLDSCDLEDDDLMLDADFAEDVSLNSDGDGMSHMAQWRRRQLCWGTQDVHNDNESDFQCYKLTEDPGNMRTDTIRDSDLILDLCPSRSPCLSPGSPGLGLDVEELADDCSAVRSQLEYLQKLLLQEEDMDDDTLTTDTLSPETNDSSHSSDTQVQVQVQALLQEVQQLREELRSRDRTIAQLTLQLTVPTATTRCHCQETTGRMDRHTQTSVAEKESVASQHLGKSTLLSLLFLSSLHPGSISAPGLTGGGRGPASPPTLLEKSQVLHPSSQKDQEPLMDPVPPPPPPTQALPPANPCSKIPADANTANSAPECRGDDGKRPRKEDKRETKERRGGAGGRSLKLPQPSKLHLFQSLSSAPTAAPPPKTRKPRPLSMPLYPESSASSGGKLKAPVSSGSSRLPKPKSH